MSLARAEKTARGVDAESEDLPANCVSASSDQRTICAWAVCKRRDRRSSGGDAAGNCGFLCPQPAYAPNRTDWTKNLNGSVFCFLRAPGWSFEQCQSLFLPRRPLRKHGGRICSRFARKWSHPARTASVKRVRHRRIPRRIQMEAAGWAPAASYRKYLRKQLFDRM